MNSSSQQHCHMFTLFTVFYFFYVHRNAGEKESADKAAIKIIICHNYKWCINYAERSIGMAVPKSIGTRVCIGWVVNHNVINHP